MTKRIVEQLHPEPPAVHLPEDLVDEDEVGRQPSGLVVGADAIRQGSQVDVHAVGKAEEVGLAGVVVAAEVVDPEHVVVLGLEDHARGLLLELLVPDVVEIVPTEKALLEHAFEDGVDLSLGVVVLRAQCVGERNPDQPRVAPHLLRSLAVVLQDAEQPVKDVADGVATSRRDVAGVVQRRSEPLHRRRAEAEQRIPRLPLSQQPVVGQDHLVQQRLPGVPREAHAGVLPLCPAHRQGEGPLELAVVDADLRIEGVAVGVERVAGAQVLLEERYPLPEEAHRRLVAVGVVVDEGRGEDLDPVGRMAHPRQRLRQSRLGLEDRGPGAIRSRQPHVVA